MNSRYYYTEYEYEIKAVDPDILRRIKERLNEGKNLINTADENNITPKHLAWVKSFETFINELDPEGELDTWGSEHSDSIVKNWYNAHYTPYSQLEIETMKLSDKYLRSIVFSNYLAVIYSILNGKVKIVKDKKRIPKMYDYDGKLLNNAIPHNAIPLFNVKADISVIDNLVFVLMPFSEPWSDYIWKKQIRIIVESLEKYKLICKRADDLFGKDVMQDIIESIFKARIIIADITGRNANVFYELGIAHALNKEVILLTQSSEHIPFDLNRFRHCIYSNTGEGYDILKKYLTLAIEEIIGNK